MFGFGGQHDGDHGADVVILWALPFLFLPGFPFLGASQLFNSLHQTVDLDYQFTFTPMHSNQAAVLKFSQTFPKYLRRQTSKKRQVLNARESNEGWSSIVNNRQDYGEIFYRVFTFKEF
jgi:hypothetical protein